MAPGARGASPWRSRWLWGSIAGALALILIRVSLWVHLTPTPAVRFLIRLYVDPPFLKAELQAWGVWAPLVFIGIQALQVVVAPIPGEITGFLGGFVFGQWVGLAYSMVGLSLGSFLAFAVGRWLGTAFVQRLVSPAVWHRLGWVSQTPPRRVRPAAPLWRLA